MSSLKDWYRYVDSKARGRTGGDGPPGEPPEDAAGETAPASRDRADVASSSEVDEATTSSAGAVAGEEGLDIWSGLFTPRRKPEPPTTGPLKRPTVRLEEVPPHLLPQAPLDSPPAPRFSLPAADVEIPAFDAFISPVVPESPPPPVAAADSPAVSAPVPETAPVLPSENEASPNSARHAGAPENALAALRGLLGENDAAARPLEPSATPDGPVSDAGAAPQQRSSGHPEAPPLASGSEAASPAPAVVPAPPSPVAAPDARPSSGTTSTEAVDAGVAPSDADEAASDEGLLPWRSPFQRTGPGRTISSGASGVRPEPLVPRSSEAEQPPQLFQTRGSRETGREEAGVQENAAHRAGEPPPRPAPGTEAWERERVERLARTFRDTLRTLEQTLATPGAQGAPTRRRSTILPAGPTIAPSPDASPVPDSPEETAEQSGRETLPESAAAVSIDGAIPVVGAEPAASTAGDALPTAAAGALQAPPEVPAAAADTTLIVDAPGRAADALTLPAESVPALAEPVASPRPVDRSRRLRVSVRQAVTAAGGAEPPAPAAIPSDSATAAGTPAPAAPARPSPVPLTLSTADQASDAEPFDPTAVEPPPSAAGIEEAALIRERLPQHMAMLLRIPTNEVAQNSYKSPFRETREDLIGRLLDPQLTLEEAARVLGVCPTTVRRYTNRGMLHCHRTPGNQRRFRMSDVLQFLEQYGDRIDRAAEVQQFEEAA